jgi:hypothetical protein
MLVFCKKTRLYNVKLSLSLNFAFIFYKNRMEIKLPDIKGTYIESCDEQTSIILNGVEKFKESKHNYLIVPMRIYNIIQFSGYFKSIYYDLSGIMHVGYLLDFHVYLDMYIPPDEILISYDKSILRDNKLNAILNGEDIIKEKRVKIT